MVRFAFSKLFWFILTFITCFPTPLLTFTCVHDEATVLKLPKSYTRSVKYKDVVEDKENNPTMFEPLKVHFYIDYMGTALPINVVHNIELALKQVRSYLSQTLKVRKQKRPFLLERFGCTKRWQQGKFKGKCEHFNKQNELCSAKDLEYIIPENFLDKVDVYSESDKDTSVAISPGAGLLDSNFIIFLTAIITSICAGDDKINSYGTYCRLDPKTNQPVAGILNICPNYFSQRMYPLSHYYSVIMHEVIHILGFSRALYEKYQPCRKGVRCDMPKNVIQVDSNNMGRLVFPLVIKHMQEHFNCDQSDFGAPMDLEFADNDTYGEITYSSHFHPVLMHSSIMTPVFTEYDKLFVDNITLAVLASTGWYRVNFSYAEQFDFGRGEGCNFGDNDTCTGSMYMCDPEKDEFGCDVSRKFLSPCQKLVDYHPCGVFLPENSGECDPLRGNLYSLDFDSLGYQQKCFMFRNINNNSWSPSCLTVRCQSSSSYDLLINMSWFTCYNSSEISAYSDTFLKCVDPSQFCEHVKTVGDVSICSREDFFVAVRMIFERPPFDLLLTYDYFKNFKVSAIKEIANQIGIPVNFISNATLYTFKQITLDFLICPPLSANMTEIIKGTQKFLDQGNFFHILRGPKDIIIASTNMNIDPEDVIAFSDYEGFYVLIILPVLCGVFVSAAFIASLVRLYQIQRHRPRRSADSSSDST